MDDFIWGLSTTEDYDFNFTDINGTDFTISPTTIPNSVYQTCEECISDLGDDCWCIEFKEGDYLQVFTISFIIWLMYMASYCLSYQRTASFIGGFSEMKISEMKSKTAWDDVREASDKYVEEGYVSGIPAQLYILLNAILCCLYFAVKLIMYLSNDPHYLGTINNDFQTLGFNEFYDARIILLVTIYVHSFMSIKQNMEIYKENKEINQKFTNLIYVICSLIFFTDFIGSIVLMCIKYPLIITALYNGAVGIFVNCIGICLIFCILPLVSCYGKLISFIFSLCVCGAGIDKPIGRFVRGLANGFSLLSLLYLLFCVILCFAFLFIGGPNYTIIYLRMNDNYNDYTIFWLYVTALLVAVCGFLCGVIITCTKTKTSRSGGYSKATQYDHPRNTNDIEIVTTVDV